MTARGARCGTQQARLLDPSQPPRTDTGLAMSSNDLIARPRPHPVRGHCGRVGEIVRSAMSGAWVMTAFAICERGRLWLRA